MSLQGCTLQWTISFIITALISSTSGWQPSNKCGYLRSDHPRSNLPHSTILTLFATNLDGAAADGPATGATPKLPKGAFAPKQSLGQNYLRKAKILETRRDARHIIYFLSNHQVRRILRVSMANLARPVEQADIDEIDRKQQAGGFARVR